MIYTLGTLTQYDADPVARGHYGENTGEGCWRTAEEAQAFLDADPTPNDLYRVYRVDADWETDTDPRTPSMRGSTYRYLLRDALVLGPVG